MRDLFQNTSTKFFAFMAALVLLSGIFGQFVNDRIDANCDVSFATPVIGPTPNSVFTSCGIIYVGNHAKAGFLDFGSVSEMNKNIREGSEVTIKSTGFGPLRYAYEVAK